MDWHANIGIIQTDTAIVSGIIQEPTETSITSKQAQELGVCVENSQGKDSGKYSSVSRHSFWIQIDFRIQHLRLEFSLKKRRGK